jgi:hypothetical protein
VQNQNYVTSNGQPANLFWCQAPIWGVRPHYYYSQIVVGLLIWGALSDKRTGLSFTVATGLRQRSHSRVCVPRSHDHVLVSQIRDFPNPEGQVSVFIALRKRVAQLYLQALGPFFSPPTTRRTVVEVFEPASTWGCLQLTQLT